MFLVQLSRAGPAWDPARPVEQQLGWEAHAAYLDALVDDGVVALGGPLADERRVILAVEAPSEHAVRAILAGDPWSGTHLVIDAVDPWTIRLDGRTRPAGRSAGPGSIVFVGTHTRAREEMRRFVEEVLGLRRITVEGIRGDVFELDGGATLVVADADDGPAERSVGLLVDDLEAVIERLHAAGVETDGIHENDRWRYTHFRPPDGRLYELVEERVRA